MGERSNNSREMRLLRELDVGGGYPLFAAYRIKKREPAGLGIHRWIAQLSRSSIYLANLGRTNWPVGAFIARFRIEYVVEGTHLPLFPVSLERDGRVDNLLRRSANGRQKDVERVAILEQRNMAHLIVIRRISEGARAGLKFLQWIRRMNQPAETHDPIELALVFKDSQIGICLL